MSRVTSQIRVVQLVSPCPVSPVIFFRSSRNKRDPIHVGRFINLAERNNVLASRDVREITVQATYHPTFLGRRERGAVSSCQFVECVKLG